MFLVLSLSEQIALSLFVSNICSCDPNSLFPLFTFTFSHLADAFIQSHLQLGKYEAIHHKKANRSLRHCSNKYKLAREGINKEKDRSFLFWGGNLG